MKKPSKGTHDPHEIFLHAYHFHECDNRLRKGPSSKDIEEVALIAHPSMVLSALARSNGLVLDRLNQTRIIVPPARHINPLRDRPHARKVVWSRAQSYPFERLFLYPKV